jgi:MFS family permease
MDVQAWGRCGCSIRRKDYPLPPQPPNISRDLLSREAPLLFAIFLDLAGFGMVIPDVQTRLESFGAGGGLIGGVLSSYFLIQVIVSPLWGRYSDRVGRKPVLVVCGLLSALSLLLYAFAHSVPLILASRLLAGFAAANTVAAQAYIADSNANEERRTEAMGRVGAAITAGLMLGPVLGGWLSSVGGNRLLGFAAAFASGLGALWIALALPHILPKPEEEKEERRGALSLLRDAPKLRLLLGLAVISFLALACLEGTFGRLIRHNLGLGPREFGVIFSYESLLGVIVQSVILAWLTKRWHLRPRLLLGSGFTLQAIGLSLTPFAPSLMALFGCSTLYGLGAGVGNPTLNAQCSEATPKERQGEMFGLLQGARSMGFLIGPTLGGVLFDWRPESPYLIAGFVLLLGAVTACIASPSASSS